MDLINDADFIGQRLSRIGQPSYVSHSVFAPKLKAARPSQWKIIGQGYTARKEVTLTVKYPKLLKCCQTTIRKGQVQITAM